MICNKKHKKTFKKHDIEAISHFSAVSTNSLRNKDLILWNLPVSTPRELIVTGKLLNKQNWREECLRQLAYQLYQELGRARLFLEGGKRKVFIVASHFPLPLALLGFVKIKEKNIIVNADSQLSLALQTNENIFKKVSKQVTSYTRKRIAFLKSKCLSFLAKMQKIFEKVKELVKEILIFEQDSLSFATTDEKSNNSDFSCSHQLRAPPVILIGGEVNA